MKHSIFMILLVLVPLSLTIPMMQTIFPLNTLLGQSLFWASMGLVVCAISMILENLGQEKCPKCGTRMDEIHDTYYRTMYNWDLLCHKCGYITRKKENNKQEATKS